MSISQENVDGYIETIRSGECISENSLKRLCSSVSTLLVEESNVQPVRSPVTVSGKQRFFFVFAQSKIICFFHRVEISNRDQTLIVTIVDVFISFLHLNNYR